MNALILRTTGIALILLLFVYTLSLVRSKRLSARLAISWIIAELFFFILVLSDALKSYIRSTLGDEMVLYAALLVGAVWIVFLMLDSLTRISSLSSKLKDVDQEVALLGERIERLKEEIDEIRRKDDTPKRPGD